MPINWPVSMINYGYAKMPHQQIRQIANWLNHLYTDDQNLHTTNDSLNTSLNCMIWHIEYMRILYKDTLLLLVNTMVLEANDSNCIANAGSCSTMHWTSTRSTERVCYVLLSTCMPWQMMQHIYAYISIALSPLTCNIWFASFFYCYRVWFDARRAGRLPLL